ncbi:phage tail tube protein [Xenorhabdus griffiniae]|uniref:Phage tail tube protein n=1 Tax=Xenorhabdus griffiniae TaxID=351672 RepID=A0ABY9XDG3_9GAMM|nr:phage tail tube protein [Xenorhabdus griffiniae]MBD1229130.1 phage tail protein [Xenorhabdus griffiniae]MBE8588939.1 phage tail protein [Xenorhabdus griffiniae]WMV70958.1 phage tail tube protein [Xenorhabdus griffiniae]WMV71657.1 phage tail tube protein [Xenorhabdus griffiniae]WNH00634.1 phage tail tube protein [Xenorhabdus griffiniae]
MSSKYEKTQGTKVSISAHPATEANPANAVWQAIDCTTKEISYTGGQKSDIEVTTLCSTEQEMTNGLAAPGEITLSGNWSANEVGQNTLRHAYDTDELHAFKVEFPTGNGYAFLAEVRQNSWSVATSGVVTASFTLRLKGKPLPLKPVPLTKNTPQGE